MCALHDDYLERGVGPAHTVVGSGATACPTTGAGWAPAGGAPTLAQVVGREMLRLAIPVFPKSEEFFRDIFVSRKVEWLLKNWYANRRIQQQYTYIIYCLFMFFSSAYKKYGSPAARFYMAVLESDSESDNDDVSERRMSGFLKAKEKGMVKTLSTYV